MVIAFANNQAMTAIQGTPSVIYTDPVPLNGNDRATSMHNVHYIWSETGSVATIAYQGEVSNDGTNWVDVTALTENRTAVGVEQLPNIGVYGAFIRFKFTLTITGSSGLVGGTCFDLHVLLEKS